MPDETWIAAPWIRNFFVDAIDPGYLYVIEHGGKYKIGSSKTRRNRLRNAKTWLPDMTIVGIKPFWGYKEKERLLHVGNAMCWYDGEWFVPYDEGFQEYFIDEFTAFSDTDINRNSVDFVYWYNGSGMSSYAIEHNQREQSTRKFLQEETAVGKRNKKP